MKLAKFALTPPIMAISLALFAADRTEPVNLYVSENGDWDPSGSGYTYTTIQGAVADATVAGDVVWVDDGFVCTEAATTSYASAKTMIIIKKAITLRSKSGYVDEAAKKGATIRGLGETTPASTATRVLGTEGGAQIIGFVIEKGCSGTSANGGGGINMSNGVISNCVIRSCVGSTGGGIRGNGMMYNTVISNCYATSGGGGAYCTSTLNCYNCDFIANSTDGSNGGGGYTMKSKSGYHPTLSNCTFRANTAAKNGVYGGSGAFSSNVKAGASDDSADLIECRFYDNVGGYLGGAARGSNYYRDCIFIGNSVTDNSSGGDGGAVFGLANGDSTTFPMSFTTKPAVLDHCTVASNEAYGAGGGISCCIASNGTKIVHNVGHGGGGGAYKCVLIDSEICDNVMTNHIGATSAQFSGGGILNCWATNCVIAGNKIWHQVTKTGSYSNGGGAAASHLTRCVISNNVARSNGGGVYAANKYTCNNCTIVGNTSNGRGGGAFVTSDAELYNCLIANNKQLGTDSCGAGGICGSWGNGEANYSYCKLVNCTVTENDGGKSPGGVNVLDAQNCIIYGNANTNGKNNNFRSVDYCCLDQCKMASSSYVPGEHNTDKDPKFVGKGEFPYAIRMHSPCKDTAEELPWMSDAADPRSTALDGHARILGKGPDMGCYEHLPLGLLFMVR